MDDLPTGVLSNHWMGLGEKTPRYFVAKDSTVSIMGYYQVAVVGDISTCNVGPVSFKPKNAKHYSIDIAPSGNWCRLSIVEIQPDGEHSTNEVKQYKEPECMPTE